MAFSLNEPQFYEFLQQHSNAFETECHHQEQLINTSNINQMITHEWENNTQIFNDFFLFEDEAAESELQFSELSLNKQVNTTKSEPHVKLGQEYMYGVIDHVLQDIKSDLGLKWSMLESSSQLLESSFESISTESPSLSNTSPVHGRTRSGSSNSTCQTITSNQSQDFELSNITLYNNHQDQSSNIHNTSKNTCADINNNNSTISHHHKIKKKSQKKKPTIQFITEEGSSYPLDLSVCSQSNNHIILNKNISTPHGANVVKNNKRTSKFHQTLKTKQNSNSSYKVRFSHNVFEEISFKNINPSQKFYKFNGIAENQ